MNDKMGPKSISRSIIIIYLFTIIPGLLALGLKFYSTSNGDFGTPKQGKMKWKNCRLRTKTLD